MPETESLRLRFDAFELDERNARLTHHGRVLAVAPKAFGVLCALARQPGQLLTKNDLLDAVWGHRHVSESVLKTTISELRATLDDDARQPRYIETASRRGYRFIGEVGAATASILSPVSTVAAKARPEPGQGGAPASVASEPAPRMIGRQAALAKLRELWGKALAGRRQVVWIVGEAGVGKTTLIRELLAGIDPQMWSHGQCVEQFGAGEPYMPLLEGLNVLCQRDPALPGMLRAAAPTWFLQLPRFCGEADRAALQQALAGSSQERMMRELRDATDVYSQTHPMLFVTEDLHWSDQATLRLMNYLARSADIPCRAMWLASFRLTEVVADDHPLKALRHELRLHKLVTEIGLDTFSEQEVGEYVADRFPAAAVSEDFVRKLHAHTDGLPLFVANVLDDLDSQGALQAGSPVLQKESREGFAVPESLAGVIEKQLARLRPEHRAVLDAASACGMDFRVQTVADTLQRAAAWVGERCEELAQQQQWLAAQGLSRLADGTLDARYGFRHALYRHVLYRRLGGATRAQLHGRVAQSMQAARNAGILVTPGELASHLELSLDFPSALREYAAAAESALRRFAPSEAMSLTAHALTLLPRCPPGTERLEQELALIAPRTVACTQLVGIGSPDARAVFAHAERLCAQLPDSPMLGVVLSGIGWMRCTGGEYAEARQLGARIFALAERFDDAGLRVSACAMIGTAAAFRGEFAAACEWLERGLAASDRLDASAQALFGADPIVWMESSLAICQFQTGLPNQAAKHLDAALRRADATGHPLDRLQALRCAGAVETWFDHGDRVAEIAAELEKVYGAHSIVQAQWPARALAGWAKARRGDPEGGYALIREGIAAAQRYGMIGGSTLALTYAAEALGRARRWDEAQAQIDEAIALAQRIGERLFYPELILERARIEWRRGRHDEARASMREAAEEARRQGAHTLVLAALVTLCELPGAAPEDLAALRTAYDRSTEGFEHWLGKRAKALLQA